MTRPTDLEGHRILLVEDEALVAMYTEAVLADAGARVEIAMRLETGLRAAEASAFDVAVLDMNLGGKSSLPIADLLADRKIPFLFVTGYGPGAWFGSHENASKLQKPFTDLQLIAALHGLVRG